MSKFITVLRLLAPAFLVVSLLHLILGPNAENLLGANIPDLVLLDATLDSQNRFYGVTFGLYGALFYLRSTDIEKYEHVLKLLLLFFFAGGLARLVSIVLIGMPSSLVLALLALELVLPLILFFWWRSIEREN